ncbi:MAG TPA: MaoC/PaaZ C-terminal domain-containing protein [Rubrivivax sp.]|nr:MaoC/PaaZ C-terminal domain-containing protein [Rubrivivax sp.]
MNLDHVSGRHFAPTNHDYEWRDSLLYALSLGFGRDPTDLDALPYVYEGLPGRPQQVVPSMAMVLGWQPFWQDDPAAAIDWKRIVHGEQHLQLHAPLPAAGRVRTEHRLVRVQDKGAGRGALLQMDTELFEREQGTHLASLQALHFLRGDGGCGDWGDAQAATPALPAIPDDTEPLASFDLPTPPDAALLYRVASRDWMPIHADPAIAREAGFERPISHGLNNLGIACRALLKTLGLDRPERLRSLAARFVAPGLPGDTVRVEIFRRDAATLQFRASAVERGVRLLDRGVAGVRD